MKVKALMLLIAFTAVSVIALPASNVAAAAFNQNSIIDDSVFDDTTTMSAAQIDAFLNSFPNSCLSTNRGFSAPRPTGYNPSQKFLYGSPVSAGQVIYDSAQAYGLNPQVLLTTLQKEEGLVRGDGPYGCSALAISASAGYACTDSDTASHTYVYTNGTDAGTLSTPLFYDHGTPINRVDNTCVNSALKAGFTEQVIRATWLLKFGEQRAEGNVGWAVIKGSWNNSDDPQTCYGGPMTQGSFQRCPSGGSTYYDGYTTIDNTAVHMDNGATAALYWYTPHFHGNQSFATLFESWFGPLIGSYLVRTVNDATVYLLGGTNKYPIGDMNILNDFSALGYVKFVDDAYMANYTAGPLLTHMVGGADGTLYFVNAGIKLPFPSCSVVSDYGYSCGSPIVTLTSYQLNKLAQGPAITHMYGTTTGKTFYVSGGAKREVFDNQSAAQAGATDGRNVLLESGVSYLPYGAPVIRSNVVAINRSGGERYLYSNNSYYKLPATQANYSYIKSLPTNSLDSSSFATGTINSNFNGFVTDATTSKKYILMPQGKVELTTPSAWNVTFSALDNALITALPTTTDPINNGLVMASGNGTVYYVTGGQKRPIPSWTDLVNLQPQPLTINTIDALELGAIPSGRLIYAPGSMVKTSTSATVYLVKSDTELMPLTSFMFPQELGAPSLLEIISPTDLSNYTLVSNLQTKITCSGQDYLGVNGTIYPLDAAALSQFGFNHADFIDAGPLCSVLPKSTQSPPTFLLASNGTIYKVQAGAKHAFTGYGAYLANGGTPQNTVRVTDYTAGLIATGASITQ